MAPLVEAVWAAASPLFDVPVAVFGHSMGAVLAYEFARRATAEGCSPIHVFVSGRRAPQLASTDAPFHLMSDDNFLVHLFRLNGMPGELRQEVELIELLLPTWRADFELCETYGYAHGPKLTCPVTAFAGAVDPQTDIDSVAAWSETTCSRFDVRVFPGDHFFFRGARNALLREIRERIASDLRERRCAHQTPSAGKDDDHEDEQLL